MKKLLLASTILASYAQMANAETSVNLYGIVDTAVSFNQIKTTSYGATGNQLASYKERSVGVDNGLAGGSYWGLRGSEEIGNGLHAIFTLEGHFNASNGAYDEAGRIFNRNAFVGFANEAWGQLTLGYQKNIADEFMPNADPFGTDFGQAGAGSVFGDSLSSSLEKSVKYLSAESNGFQFGAVFSYDHIKRTVNGVTTREGNKQLSLGLKYSRDALFLGAVYDTVKEVGGIKSKSWAIGGSYDFNVVKLYGAFGQQRNGMFGEILSLAATEEINGETIPTAWNRKGYRQSSWLAGLSAPISDNGTLLFSYQGISAKNTQIDSPIKASGHIFSFGYTHELSKRTSLYGVASYGKTTIKNYDGTAFTGKEKIKSTLVAIGLRHAF
ncbi:hypothetical protein V757_00060 [Pelistega indica]|uniref:Porin domain-containing protein n=1 Tax=Pelistega indica TaxID=1414851 RepID=V8GBM3_9BURK|nr:porin [Pelistega indica]ETD73138.1 hypothetical protein V757_00060 [Pelistega indica]